MDKAGKKKMTKMDMILCLIIISFTRNAQTSTISFNETDLQSTLQPLENPNSTLTIQLEEKVDDGQRILKQQREMDNDMDRSNKRNMLWETAQNNEWYKWASFTAKEIGVDNCLLCAKSPLNKVTVIPNPHDYRKCASFNKNFCGLQKNLRPYCSAECLGLLGNSKLQDKFYKPHYGDWCQYWDINQNIKIEKRKVELPPWYNIDYSLEYECFNKTMGTVNLGEFKGKCDVIWNLNKVAPRIPRDMRTMQAHGERNGVGIALEDCENQTVVFPPIEIYTDQTIVVADFFWICGKERLLASLPLEWKGVCTRVRLIQEISIAEWESQPNIEDNKVRTKRAYRADPNVYLDSIGQPRNIPYQFKARDEVKSGFESIFVWITQNKNTEWINYIYYNQQRFINYTDDALNALGEQLEATSTMTWQNRQALNWLLADKGGVCVLFGDQCCTFIPNNTAPEGTFTKAMNKIKSLRVEVSTNAGRDSQMWDWFDLTLGKWGAWFTKLGVFLGVAVLIGGLLFCCVFPILKSFIINATVKQMEMLRYQDGKLMQAIYPMWKLQLHENSSNSDDDDDDDDDS